MMYMLIGHVWQGAPFTSFAVTKEGLASLC